MRVLVALAAVVALLVAVSVGIDVLGWRWLFGVIVPYSAGLLFLVGIVARVLDWASSPVPFRVPTTCGQQRSLAWIPPARLDNPSTTLGVAGRMALEVLAFRSLFRNIRSEVRDGRLAHGSNKWLWLGGLAFHWSLLFVLLRHLRFATEPVPRFVLGVTRVDGFLQVGLPVVNASTALFVAALAFLFLRRVTSPQLRYISLPSDYFSLFLLLAVGASGIFLRHFAKVDVPAAKALVLGLMSLSPRPPAALGSAFYAHLFLVSVLLAYLPFSKLAHMAGIFLSPTRNLANDSRARRHVNPWNHPVSVHTYEEYEDEFRERMREAGLPLEKE
jgi:nitrate reductase gamma subunit